MYQDAADARHLGLGKGAWVRWERDDEEPTTAFFCLNNRSDKDLKITAMTCDSYDRIQLKNAADGEDSTPGPIKFTIPAQGEYVFAPGGNHIVMEQPNRDIEPGENVDFLI